MKLGIYSRQSYILPILMTLAAFGWLWMIGNKLDLGSHVAGILLGGGVIGLLYRHTYFFSKANESGRDTE